MLSERHHSLIHWEDVAKIFDFDVSIFGGSNKGVNNPFGDVSLIG